MLPIAITCEEEEEGLMTASQNGKKRDFNVN
jgi:hypothetical protein